MMFKHNNIIMTAFVVISSLIASASASQINDQEIKALTQVKSSERDRLAAQLNHWQGQIDKAKKALAVKETKAAKRKFSKKTQHAQTMRQEVQSEIEKMDKRDIRRHEIQNYRKNNLLVFLFLKHLDSESLHALTRVSKAATRNVAKELKRRIALLSQNLRQQRYPTEHYFEDLPIVRTLSLGKGEILCIPYEISVNRESPPVADMCELFSYIRPMFACGHILGKENSVLGLQAAILLQHYLRYNHDGRYNNLACLKIPSCLQFFKLKARGTAKTLPRALQLQYCQESRMEQYETIYFDVSYFKKGMYETFSQMLDTVMSQTRPGRELYSWAAHLNAHLVFFKPDRTRTDLRKAITCLTMIKHRSAFYDIRSQRTTLDLFSELVRNKELVFIPNYNVLLDIPALAYIQLPTTVFVDRPNRERDRTREEKLEDFELLRAVILHLIDLGLSDYYSIKGQAVEILLHDKYLAEVFPALFDEIVEEKFIKEELDNHFL